MDVDINYLSSKSELVKWLDVDINYLSSKLARCHLKTCSLCSQNLLLTTWTMLKENNYLIQTHFLDTTHFLDRSLMKTTIEETHFLDRSLMKNTMEEIITPSPPILHVYTRKRSRNADHLEQHPTKLSTPKKNQRISASVDKEGSHYCLTSKNEESLASQFEPKTPAKKHRKTLHVVKVVNDFVNEQNNGQQQKQLQKTERSAIRVFRRPRACHIKKRTNRKHVGKGALSLEKSRGQLKGKNDTKAVPIKKRSQPKAKICKLLTMDEGMEEKLWEERVRSFISCMNGIQGNRRFTPWKGSVVDSVIGVFLTQNVSDSMSSSAFISLVARFPLHSTSGNSAHNKEVRKVEVEKANVKKLKGKKAKVNSRKATKVDFSHWEQLRREVVHDKATKEETRLLDHEALRCAEVDEIAHAIMGRGQHNNLAERIKEFLNKMVENHENIDLEWLRHITPDEAKKYLMDIYGLGLKSAECIRLLTLHQAAFPVDTNVARIAVRLGWVPVQSSSEDDLLHELEMYPNTSFAKGIQEHLWARLCKLDQPTLYELHYQMITFGKVFCTKKNPNCKACPLSLECKHYTSELSSKGLTLPGTEEEAVVPDIEDAFYREKPDEILKLLPDADMSKASVTITPEAAFVSMRKLKNVTRLRREYTVYELPDKHHLLNGLDKRLKEDPCPYLLAVRAPVSGEMEESATQPSERCHSLLESGKLCKVGRCLSSDRILKRNPEIVHGTLLIPVRTTMRGGFPLNGTYFQINEVFADHESSLRPIPVQRALLCGLRRSFVYFGTSMSSIYKGLLKEDIKRSFDKGYICVRGFDRKTRAPRTLAAIFQANNKQKQQVSEG